MSKQRRWLWPCSEAKILRNKHYQKLVYESYPAADHDILVAGSDEELDHHQHKSKKRRIEFLATSYLSGNPLFIASASSKGPFEKDLPTTYDKYANYIVGEPLLPDPPSASKYPTKAPAKSSINQKKLDLQPKQHEEQEEEDAAGLPTPVHASSFFEDRHHLLDRTPDPQSDDDDARTPILPPPIDTPSRPPQSSPNRILSPLARYSSGVSPTRPLPLISASAWQLVPPSGFTPINQPVIAPSTSPQNSSRKSLPVIEQLDASETTVCHHNESAQLANSDQPLSKTTKPLKPARAFKKKKNQYLEAVATSHNASPLIFRRKNDPPKNHPPQNDPATAAAKHVTTSARALKLNKTNPRRVLFNSSINLPSLQPIEPLESQEQLNSSACAPNPQSASPLKPTTQTFAPAIDISFDQGSLAMNFDFIDHHTNNILPTSTNSTRSQFVSKQLKRAMRESGASFTTSPFAKDLGILNFSSPAQNPPSTSATPAVENLSSLPIPENEVNSEHGLTDEIAAEPMDVGTTDAEAIEAEETELIRTEFEEEDNVPFISTQAAMQDAHHGLFDSSSPEVPRAELEAMDQATPGVQQDLSSVHDIVITPFHQFHANIAAEAAREAQSPPPNTQALFDNMSPFLSPEKPKKIAPMTQKSKKRASFAPIQEESNDMSVLLSPEKPGSPAAVQYDDVVVAHPALSSQAKDGNSTNQQVSPLRSSPMLADGLETNLEDGENGRTYQVDTNRDASPEELRSGSSSPDIIFSQRSIHSASQHEKPPVPQDQSVRFADLLEDLQFSRGSRINIDDLYTTNSSRTGQHEARSSGKSSPRSSAKSRTSRRSSHRSSAFNQPQESLSRPENIRRKSLRSRLSLSQPDPSPPHTDATPAEQRLTGSTTIADETVSAMQQQPPASTEEPQSSYLIGRSLLNQTPLPQPSGTISVPATSARSKKQFRATAASSYQAAQRVADLDLDSTIDDITESILSPWDVESAMRMPLNASAG